MKSKVKNEIGLLTYLARMGALSLKSCRGRLELDENAPNVPLPSGDNLDDSLSETRALSESSDSDLEVDQPDPFPAPRVNKRAHIEPIRRAREKAEKCGICGRGFQFARNTHIKCVKCALIYHKRHFTAEEREDPFQCMKCKTSTAPVDDLTTTPDANPIPESSLVSIPGNYSYQNMHKMICYCKMH